MANEKKSDHSEPHVKSDALIKLYRERLMALKKGREYYAKGEYPKAVERYQYYLNSLAKYFEIEESKLKPSLFDAQKDTAELLLISHVYWDLAKAYDRAPSLQREFQRCLDQFALFTMGYKYQHVNSRMVKKYLRQKACYNPQAFKHTLKKIQVDSKGCFIATYAYGDDHQITQNLRVFKKHLASLPLGLVLIDFYYFLAPKLISFFEKRPHFYRPIFFLVINPICRILAGRFS